MTTLAQKMKKYAITNNEEHLLYKRTVSSGETAYLGNSTCKFEGLSKKDEVFLSNQKLYTFSTAWFTAQDMIINGGGFEETYKKILKQQFKN